MSDKTRDCVARPAKVKIGQLYTLGELECLGLVTLGRGKVISKIDLANTPGNNPVYSSSAMGNGEIGRYGKYMFEDERITWSVDGGGRLFYREPHKYSVTNVCGWLKVNTPDIDTKFLYLLLTSRWGRMTFDYTYKAHPSVIREAYRDLSFPILSEQHRLTAKIDQITALIKARELQLSKFDQLVKSRFVEMFGASQRQQNLTLGDVASRVKVAFVGTCAKYYTGIEDGVPMIRTTNITKHGLDLADLKYVSRDFHEKNKKSQLHEGDILIARFGSNGLSCIYHGAEANCLNAIIIEPDYRKVNSVFLSELINSSYVQDQVSKNLVGTTFAILNTKGLVRLRIGLPPLPLQREFAVFVGEVDKSEFAVRKSLEELQKLYRQQLQEAFG